MGDVPQFRILKGPDLWNLEQEIRATEARVAEDKSNESALKFRLAQLEQEMRQKRSTPLEVRVGRLRLTRRTSAQDAAMGFVALHIIALAAGAGLTFVDSVRDLGFALVVGALFGLGTLLAELWSKLYENERELAIEVAKAAERARGAQEILDLEARQEKSRQENLRSLAEMKYRHVKVRRRDIAMLPVRVGGVAVLGLLVGFVLVGNLTMGVCTWPVRQAFALAGSTRRFEPDIPPVWRRRVSSDA